MQTTITLPPGVTWATPPAELYRHIYPQCTGLADLIGSIQDRELAEKEVEAELGALENRNKALNDALNDSAKAMESACEALFELSEGLLDAHPLKAKLDVIMGALTQASDDANAVAE